MGFYDGLAPAFLEPIEDSVVMIIYDDELYGERMDKFISSVKRLGFVLDEWELKNVKRRFEETYAFHAEFKLDFDLFKCVTLDTGEHGCWHFYGMTLHDALDNMWWYAPRYIEEMYDIDDIDGYRFHIKGDDNEYCVCSALFHAFLDHGSGDSEEEMIKDFLECVLMYVEEQKHSVS